MNKKELEKLHKNSKKIKPPKTLNECGGTMIEMYPIKLQKGFSKKKFKGFDVLPDPDAFPFEIKSKYKKI